MLSFASIISWEARVNYESGWGVYKKGSGTLGCWVEQKLGEARDDPKD